MPKFVIDGDIPEAFHLSNLGAAASMPRRSSAVNATAPMFSSRRLVARKVLVLRFGGR